MSSDPNREKLLSLIECVFPTTPVPAEDRLLAIDGDEAREDTRLFIGRKWSELDADFVHQNGWALSWFTAEAFCYYLPAFLKAMITTPNFSNYYFVSTYSYLEPAESHTLTAFRKKRIEALTELQRDFLIAWLEWMIDKSSTEPIYQKDLVNARNVLIEGSWKNW